MIEESLTYLDAIYKWLENDHSNFKSKNLVLVGGWAVDSFNPWFGSIDIDLVTNSRIRNSLQHYLKRELKFRTEEILPGSKTVAKVTEDGKNIVIDFIQKIMTFEGVWDAILRSTHVEQIVPNAGAE